MKCYTKLVDEHCGFGKMAIRSREMTRKQVVKRLQKILDMLLSVEVECRKMGAKNIHRGAVERCRVLIINAEHQD